MAVASALKAPGSKVALSNFREEVTETLKVVSKFVDVVSTSVTWKGRHAWSYARRSVNVLLAV
jgi:hypothetical protein